LSQQQLLTRVVSVLEQSEIDYMLTGAFASSMQGEPRSTHDIDFVVLIETSDIRPLIRSFPAPDFYIAEVAIREAIETGGVFNLIDTVTGDEADFWMLTQDPFDQSRFARKQTVQVFGISLKSIDGRRHDSSKASLGNRNEWQREGISRRAARLRSAIGTTRP
jgi:hypothetical protein